MLMIYDISMEINPNIQTYKRDKSKSPVFNQTGTFDKNGVYETTLTIGLHTGTHVDYPLHMIENGKTSNSEVLEKLIGKAKVYDLTSVTDSIGYDDIKDLDIAENDFDEKIIKGLLCVSSRRFIVIDLYQLTSQLPLEITGVFTRLHFGFDILDLIHGEVGGECKVFDYHFIWNG